MLFFFQWEMVGKCDSLITVLYRKEHDSDLDPSINPSCMKLCDDRNELVDRAFVPHLKYVTLEKEEISRSSIVVVNEKNNVVLQLLGMEKVIQFDETFNFIGLSFLLKIDSSFGLATANSLSYVLANMVESIITFI